MKVAFLDVNEQNKILRKESIAAFINVLDSGDFILGEQVRRFEQEFAAYCNVRFAVGVNSGSDALFLALLSLGVKAGDEVICPVYTYIATALSISFAGAKPVFADIDKSTFNLDPADIEKKITKRTKAIIAVHLYGMPAPMPDILRIARKYKLKVIEDAAQSHGAGIKAKKNKWQKVGTFGDIGCFSFYPTKNLSGCGDAGLIVSNNNTVYKKLLMLRDQGRRGKNRYIHYVLGVNSRLDSIQAALLREKLKFLDKWNSIRQKRAHLYSKLLQGIPGITIPHEEKDYKHVFHLYPILVKQRDVVCEKLRKYNVYTGIIYHLPLHLQPAYKSLKYKKGDFPNAEYVCQHILCLPMHSAISEKQVKFVAESLKRIIGK